MKQFVRTLLIGTLALSMSNAVAQIVDPTFQAFITTKAQVKDAILYPDGKYLLCGGFIRANGAAINGIVRFNADGSIDNSFNAGEGPNGTIEACALQADGKIIVVGAFTTFNGANMAVIVRLNANGTVDPSFNAKAKLQNTGVPFNLLLQPDGKMLVTAPFSEINGVTATSKFYRFNPDGTLDNGFSVSSNLYSTIYDIGLTSTGKVVIVGILNSNKGIAVLNSSGTADPSFDVGLGFNASVNEVLVVPGDKFLVAGGFTQFNGAALARMAMLQSTGALDNSFVGNGAPENTVTDLFLQSDGKILAVGFLSSYGANSVKWMVRFSSTGAFDNTLAVGTGPNFYLDLVRVNSAGDILVAGAFVSFNGQQRSGVAIINSTGTLKAMSPLINLQQSLVDCRVLKQGGDKVLLAHSGNEISGQPSSYFERLNLDGTIDVTFSGSSKPNNRVNDFALESSGSILIVGDFTQYNAVAAPRIARLSSNGVLDNTFKTNNGTGFNGFVTVVRSLSDGKILVGGGFTSFNGTTRRALVRLNASGSIDAAFNTGDIFPSESTVLDVEVDATGKIYVVGRFNSVNGSNIHGVVRLNADGTVDNSFAIGVGATDFSGNSSYVNDVVILDNGKILISGALYKVNNVSVGSIARIDPSGAVDATYSYTDAMNKMVKRSDGKVMALEPTRITRLNADGSLDGTFSPTEVDAWPNSIAFFGEDMIVGGTLTKAKGNRVSGIAKLIDPVADAPSDLRISSFTPSQVVLSWKDNSTTETSFEVLKAVSTGTFTVAQTVAPNTTTVTLAGLTPESRFRFIIRAVIAGNNTAFSNVAGQLTPPNEWSAIAATQPGRSDGVAVSVGGKAYVGLGRDATGALKDWWEFNPEGNVWTAKLDFPGTSRIGAVAFVANNKIYVGTGNDFSGNGFKRDFYEYDPLNNTWTTKADFPADINSGAGITSGVAFSINNLGYVGLGNTGLNNTKAFYKYNSTANTWTAIAPFGGDGRTGAAAFAVGGMGYVGMGFGGLSPNRNDLWQYNPYTNEWVEKAANPGTGRGGAAVTVLGEEAFFFGGVEKTSGSGPDVYTGTTFVYSIAKNSWSMASPHPTSVRTDALAFSLDGKAYVYGGFKFASGNIYLSDVYAFRSPASYLSAAPKSLTASYAGDNAISISWQDVATNETGFRIEFAVGNNATFTTLATASRNFTSHVHSGVVPNTQYKYRVAAINEYGLSAYSNEVSILTPPNDWSGPIATALPGRSDGVAAVVGGKAYVGLGQNGSGTLKDWWEFNPVGNVWTQKTDFPGTARIGAVAFVANNKIYVGTGNDFSGTGFKRDFFEYDPASNSWSAKADFPEDFNSGAGITSGVAFAIDNIGYVGLGNTGLNNTKAFYRYSPATNAWTAITPFAGTGRTGAVGFSLEGAGFVGMGYGALSPNFTDLWRYDSGSNAWSQMPTKTGTGRGGAAVAVIDLNAFFFGGVENATGSFGADVYTNTNFVYSSNKAWSTGSPVPNSVRTDAMTFTIGNIAYLYGGFKYASGNVYLSDMYSFKSYFTYFPKAPKDAEATCKGGTQIDIVWKAALGNETSYVLEYAVGNSTNYVQLATVLAPNTNYTHNGVIPGELYSYRIKAVNDYGVSPYTTLAQVTATATSAPPTSLFVVGLSATDILVNWTDASTDETGFHVFRSTGDNANYTLIRTVSANATSTLDASLTPGQDYYYKVRAFNAGGPSAFSNEATTPFAPTGLTVQSFNNAVVNLSWTNNSTDQASFEIYRSVATNTGYGLLASVGANVATYSDATVKDETTYYYKVRTVLNGSKSTFSTEVTVSTLPNPPAAPSNLAVMSFTNKQVILSWKDNSSKKASFEIYRSVGNNTSYALIQTATPSSSGFSEDNLQPNTKYYYKVRAVNAGGNSAYSNEVDVTTLPNLPAAPTGLTIQVTDNDQVKLSWTDNADNETGFEIHRSSGTNTDYIVDQVADANATALVLTPPFNISVYYKVRAKNAAGFSAFTDEVSTVVTGIEKKLTFVAYPNPIQEQLTLYNPIEKAIQIKIINDLGQVVQSEILQPHASKTIMTAEWSAGIYLVVPQGAIKAIRLHKN